MSQEKPTVMVVEDEDMLLQAISKKLELNQITPISCTTGTQAIDYLGSLPELPDAIWLDYHLKDMDGLTFMNNLRQNEQWGRIPVIVVSNSASDDKIKSMLALGAKKYLLKAEHRLDDLVKTMHDLIVSGELREAV